MNPLPLSQIAQWAGGSLSTGDGTVVIDKISTDSRTIKRGELFAALRGENFDGHNFVEATAIAGAAGAIVDSNWKGNVPENFALVRARDTLQAYQQLAANYRKSLTLRCGRNYWKQRQNQHERLRRSGPCPPVSSDENTGELQ
jgi:UDP-N-acetylmuramoyl-tripeptide--D-alanyl-D-alanine ligase